MEDETSISLPKHIFNELSVLIDPNLPGPKRQHHCNEHWLPNLSEEADAYITFSGNVHQAHLPALYAWNASFRKAYTILFWIRPRLGDIIDSPGEVSLTGTSDDGHRRLLYRLATDSDDANATGVCVTCSPWRVVDDSGENRTLQTTLTAYALPFAHPSKMAGGGFLRGGGSSSTNFSSWTQQTLELTENTWHLVGCSHVYPYLKRPMWTVSVDGKNLSTGPAELHYPVLHETRKLQRAMEDCQVLQNITAGGAQLMDITPASDDQKPASQLQAEAVAQSGPVCKLMLDLASLSIYNDAVPLNVQAILADSGPSFSQQQNGACILPPVPNWTKGCSLSAGPKVGIPLTVHGLALDVQRLSGSLVFSATATSTKVLGGSTAPNARFSCPYHPQVGRTEATPRVGLIQPQPTSPIDDDERSVLYITGECTLTDVLSNYLLHHGPENLCDWTNEYTKNWSLALGQQNPILICVLPFFLALTPPAPSLMESSCRHLFSLYHGDCGFAVGLIRMLAALIRTGGSRVHEDVLQNGILHILATSLRLGLVRAQKLKLLAMKTEEEFLQKIPSWDDVANLVSPPGVNNAIALAVAELLDACCGPDSATMNELRPSIQVRRTSDLALTAVFGLGLDWDLWANGSYSTIDSIAQKYGGTCLTSGYVMRSQISVQYFLDRSGTMKGCETSLTRLLLPMLLSSLTNTRSISQGEKDVLALVAALSQSSLGTTISDVVLSTLVGILVWCEVLPPEASPGISSGAEESDKVQVAGRLGRNLLMGQFHDVIAPVLLSRTVFSGETAAESIPWQAHWKMCLLVYSWLASIAGEEGVGSAQSTGSLMLASSLAGSLENAMCDFDIRVASTLFLPSPNMALWIGASVRNEWSYKDLLADRLHIMIPMLPSMVVSAIASDSNELLAELFQSVCGALERVFGGVMHSAGRRPVTKASGSSETIQAAKSYVPQLLVVAMVIEKHLSPTKDGLIKIDKGSNEILPRDKIADTDSMRGSATMKDLAGEIDLSALADTPRFLQSCQSSVLRTASCLMVHSMSLGGEGVASTILGIVASTLNEPSYYQTPDEKTADSATGTMWKNQSALNVMCRVVADIVVMSLKREQHWEVWGYEMSSAMMRVCHFVDEKGLLDQQSFSPDQVILINSLVEVLVYGRDSSGWCQLTLPPLVSAVDVAANSRALLPALRPCLKSVSQALTHISRSTTIEVIDTVSGKSEQPVSLLNRVVVELDITVTAAVVGLSFASARDVALQVLADIRRAILVHDDVSLKSLFVKVTNELAVRYESEKRLRGNALFDAYEDDSNADKAALGSLAVESMILGTGGLFGQSDDIAPKSQEHEEDFVFFPTNEDTHVGALGFESLRGLSVALEKWKNLHSDDGVSAFAEAMTALCTYLDALDERKLSREPPSTEETNKVSPLPLLGSATAADAMSTFFEFAAAEKTRQKDMISRHLPPVRSSRVSFAERVCWSRYSSISNDTVRNAWEQSIPDGNRDVRSRISMLPCSPQFSRYLPRYLDMTGGKHSADSALNGGVEAQTNCVNGEKLHPAAPTEIDKLTKDLIDLGNVEIVDITKMEAEDDKDNLDPLVPMNNNSTDDSPVLYDEDYPESNEVTDEAENEIDVPEENEDLESIKPEFVGASSRGGFTTSSFSTSPDNTTSSLGLMQSAASGMIDLHLQNCTHVKPEGNRQCTLLLTSSHLILEYDGHPDGYFEGEILAMEEEADRQRRIAEDTGNSKDTEAESIVQKKDERRHRAQAAMRPKSIRWNLSEISHIYLRR